MKTYRHYNYYLFKIINKLSVYKDNKADYKYIYFLLDRYKRVVYLGITKNLDKRISQHKKTKFFSSYKFIEIDSNIIVHAERELLHFCLPKYNKHIGYNLLYFLRGYNEEIYSYIDYRNKNYKNIGLL